MDFFVLDAVTTRTLGPLDLALAEGECVCLSGPSGAGKTLLLRSACDLDPHGGRLYLEGRPSDSFTPAQWRHAVGFLPAESPWWGERVGEHFGGFDETAFAALGFGREVLEWEVARCSTGERQRLALLRLLANRPRVLLLDEPTASLDPNNSERVEALVAAQRDNGVAVLWVSHDPAQVRRVSDRHYRVENGTLTAVAA